MRKEILKNTVKTTTDARLHSTQHGEKMVQKIQSQGVQLQKYNTANDNKHNTYRFSNQNMVNTVTRQNTTGDTTSKYFQSKIVGTKAQWMGQQVRYTISSPIFKDSNQKTSVVVFVYNAFANQVAKAQQDGKVINNNTTTMRMINNVSQGAESTNNTTSRHFGKKVEVEPIITKYDYFSSEIFSENTSGNINRFGTFKKGYTRITNNNINATATPATKSTQINKTGEHIGQVRANNITNATSSGAPITPGEFTNKGNVVWNTTNNKYTIGYSFEFAGKTPKAVSTARTTKDIRFSGTTKCNTSDNASVTFNTNSRISNISQAQKSNINKNGKFNVRIKTGHT
uniref:ribosomal protein S3 n=1 Tax=Magnusiomyces suaveolens TaxID=44074 RepID=UPI001BEE98AA|nr:ribosomal protein S3 [Saprochaete suaveolens]QUV75118.1 ribosomal protein S3 [Saprochaete suaveolens]